MDFWITQKSRKIERDGKERRIHDTNLNQTRIFEEIIDQR